MAGHFNFAYRAKEDVVIVKVSWNLETNADVDAWFEAYRAHFDKHFRRKIDAIFDLTDFHVHPRVAPRFGELRAKLLAEYTGRTYRVHLDPKTKAFMYTSRVLHGGAANDFASIEDAIAQLRADRAVSGRSSG
jgi:hypothetical protein